MDIKTLSEIKNNFIDELVRAERNEPSSLPYIRHKLQSDPLISDNQVFQVIVIGGTVFRSALCKKENKEIKVISKNRLAPPKFSTAEDFLSFVCEHIDSSVSTLALNLAYPLEPIFENSHLDGVLISGSKENEFSGLVGKKVGQSISERIENSSGRHITVSVANDTLCLLLSGLSQFKKEELFGGIIGTGVNLAIFNSAGEAVNLESANFNKFSLSAEAKYIDDISTHKGKAIFEKEVSGAYLYKHYNLRHPGQLISDTGVLAQLSQGTDSRAQEAQKLFDHSASLVACQIAGILEFKERDMVGIMEGSLFWKADNYKMLVETYVSMLTKYSVHFTKVDDDSIIGGAMLVG